MMRLGVVDFLAFSRVCKSWRSLALSNMNMFIVSRPPMSVSISTDANHESKCYLEDFEGRKLKISLPHSDYKACVGVSYGYLILLRAKTNDFWLMNPITRHEFHVPFPFLNVRSCTSFLGAILVFSPLISGWVFVVFDRYFHKIWFVIFGKREWTYVTTHFSILDLHAFRGKIYTLHLDNFLSEMRLFPTPEVTLLEFNNFLKPNRRYPRLVSLGEKLYVINRISEFPYMIQEINFSKMEWVSCEKTVEEYAFFLSSDYCFSAFIRIETWVDLYSQYGKHSFPDKNGKGKLFRAKMWYFFHDCLNVNFLHQ
ncbi:uncharacterized protein LOC111900521 isoform X1 [Lactuca sativa]|uniref:F-box domain-containing protein n=2 Tax=Lactuca sativa TaxID=4236 RepID=A0A9R1X3W1_LACSA|nr:uncharacterized protein LOC111900521 isoform X1 [Lactuca sativa]KAJ0198291.1 hypothetical protein LSAT_V11C700380300 [Lactuca sativa]